VVFLNILTWLFIAFNELSALSMIMKKLLFFISLLIGLSATAQYDPGKVNPKADKAYEDALEKYRDGLLKEAIVSLKKAVDLDKNFLDAYLFLGDIYSDLKDYSTAVSMYETGRSIDTAFFKYSYLKYSTALAGLGKFSNALDAINKYLANPKLGEKSILNGRHWKNNYEFALQYADKHPMSGYVFAPLNLGDNINSEFSEYYPSITINDSVFVFTRRTNRAREDFFSSDLSKDGYTKAKPVEGKLNVEPFKGAINISQDGEWLVFAADYGQKGYGGFDIYISYSTPQGWSEPENLGRNINSEAWESAPSLSPDKKALYFVSTKPGGQGGSDIYVTFKTPRGWIPAMNMGPEINTAGDEQAPFIHADNQTLYFTSNGLQGYGGNDIFLTRKVPGTGKWSIPENLGYPINTIENEGSLFVASNGVTAYYASDRSDSRGGLDLYKFDLREDVRPYKTLYVQGYVYDSKTKKGLPSSVELIDNNTNTAVQKVQTDETGFYFVTLPVGKDYTFTVNRQGYLFYSKLYELSSKKPDSTYRNDIPLQPIELNATMALKNIQFELNSYKLLPVSLVELDKLLQLLTENPQLKVEISGHTDNIGSAADNLRLSQNRAKAVVEYLVSKGIDPKRLTSKGYGATKPVADNKTEEGRALNRRTEFTITGI
jgi:outer membrane protein OmpA-like peptidoglycan-associated protein